MRLEDVWLRYGRRGAWVLREVTATVEPGEVAVVLGSNGVGKSTLLQIAAGVLRPSRGAVRDRPDVVGWVPERFPGEQPFTVEEYLTSMGRLRGLSESALKAAVDQWSERLGLEPYRGVKMPELSKGTAQKVGLAQALLEPPQLLILDEPWEGLDAATRDLVPELVSEVTEAGGAVLVSDHRGETVRLPDATLWAVADGTVHVEAGAEEPMCVVELAVAVSEVRDAVARLEADGHYILAVRQPTSKPDAAAGPTAAAVGANGRQFAAGPGGPA